MSDTKSISIHSEKEIVENCISLMYNLTEHFKEYLEFMNIEPESDEEIFGVSYSYFEIVQKLLLNGTSHSGGTSTRTKCKELGFDSSDVISFNCANENNE